jgi:hypothetical protein
MVNLFRSYSGSITLEVGRQDYDIYNELKDEAGNRLAAYMGTGSLDVRGRMKIFEVYHYAPIQYVFNSNLASNLHSYRFTCRELYPRYTFLCSSPV